jgi:serine/threonine protein phosphatase PrpC
MNMEDAHICDPNIIENTAVFGVFDGHGGDKNIFKN